MVAGLMPVSMGRDRSGSPSYGWRVSGDLHSYARTTRRVNYLTVAAYGSETCLNLCSMSRAKKRKAAVSRYYGHTH